MGMAASFLYLPCCLCRPTCCCPSIPVSVCLLFCLSVRARACVFVYLSIATSPTRALCLIGQRSSHRRGLSHTAGGSVLAIIRSAQARWERARCLGGTPQLPISQMNLDKELFNGALQLAFQPLTHGQTQSFLLSSLFVCLPTSPLHYYNAIQSITNNPTLYYYCRFNDKI